MFIAMNRFRVKKGSEEAFEQVWLSRDTQLTKVPGFVEFHLLKGPEHEDYTLYSSHTVWQSKATFEAWTKSEAFRLAHRDAGQNKPLYLDHPQFEGFEVRQTVRRGDDAVAQSFSEAISPCSEVCSVNISRLYTDMADWSLHDPLRSFLTDAKIIS